MATWQIVDESCNINFKQNGVSVGTYAKNLITLEIILAGEPLNDTLVDNVFVLHDGKYGVEIPYNDTTGGYGSAEALRTAITTLLNTNPCTSGSGGGVGTLQQVTTLGNTTNQTIVVDAGGGSQTQISPSQVITGTGGGATSMSSDGTIYSSDNGGGLELRTTIKFDDITITSAGITKVQLNSFGIFVDSIESTLGNSAKVTLDGGSRTVTIGDADGNNNNTRVIVSDISQDVSINSQTITFRGIPLPSGTLDTAFFAGGGSVTIDNGFISTITP